MITEVNVDMVLIKPDEAVEAVSLGGIIAPDEAKANAMKKQNRGTVQVVGNKCEWVKNGDWVSFYKNAATEIQEDGISYVVIHEGHILAKFKKTVTHGEPKANEPKIDTISRANQLRSMGLLVRDLGFATKSNSGGSTILVHTAEMNTMEEDQWSLLIEKLKKTIDEEQKK